MKQLQPTPPEKEAKAKRGPGMSVRMRRLAGKDYPSEMLERIEKSKVDLRLMA